MASVYVCRRIDDVRIVAIEDMCAIRSFVVAMMNYLIRMSVLCNRASGRCAYGSRYGVVDERENYSG